MSGPPRVDRRLVMAGTAVAAVAAERGLLLRHRPAAATGTSVAVLPFANLSGDPGQDYISDGMAGELRDSLGRLPGAARDRPPNYTPPICEGPKPLSNCYAARP